MAKKNTRKSLITPEIHVIDGFSIEAYRSIRDIPIYTTPNPNPPVLRKRKRGRPPTKSKAKKATENESAFIPIQPIKKRKVARKPDCCHRCLSTIHNHLIALCSLCDRVYHMYCLTPPKSSLPPAGVPFYCPRCEHKRKTSPDFEKKILQRRFLRVYGNKLAKSYVDSIAQATVESAALKIAADDFPKDLRSVKIDVGKGMDDEGKGVKVDDVTNEVLVKKRADGILKRVKELRCKAMGVDAGVVSREEQREIQVTPRESESIVPVQDAKAAPQVGMKVTTQVVDDDNDDDIALDVSLQNIQKRREALAPQTKAAKRRANPGRKARAKNKAKSTAKIVSKVSTAKPSVFAEEPVTKIAGVEQSPYFQGASDAPIAGPVPTLPMQASDTAKTLKKKTKRARKPTIPIQASKERLKTVVESDTPNHARAAIVKEDFKERLQNAMPLNQASNVPHIVKSRTIKAHGDGGMNGIVYMKEQIEVNGQAQRAPVFKEPSSMHQSSSFPVPTSRQQPSEEAAHGANFGQPPQIVRSTPGQSEFGNRETIYPAAANVQSRAGLAATPVIVPQDGQESIDRNRSMDPSVEQRKSRNHEASYNHVGRKPLSAVQDQAAQLHGSHTSGMQERQVYSNSQAHDYTQRQYTQNAHGAAHQSLLQASMEKRDTNEREMQRRGLEPSYSAQQSSYAMQQSAYPVQQSSYPMQSPYPVQQSTYAEQQTSYPEQQSSYSKQQSSYPVQQSSYAEQQQPSYPLQQPSYPEQQQSFSVQQPCYAQQQPSYPAQQSSYAEQQQQSYPAQQSSYAEQQSSYAEQQSSYAEQQSSYAEQQSSNPMQQPSYEAQQSFYPEQQSTYAAQQSSHQAQQPSYAAQQSSCPVQQSAYEADPRTAQQGVSDYTSKGYWNTRMETQSPFDAGTLNRYEIPGTQLVDYYRVPSAGANTYGNGQHTYKHNGQSANYNSNEATVQPSANHASYQWYQGNQRTEYPSRHYNLPQRSYALPSQPQAQSSMNYSAEAHGDSSARTVEFQTYQVRRNEQQTPYYNQKVQSTQPNEQIPHYNQEAQSTQPNDEDQLRTAQHQSYPTIPAQTIIGGHQRYQQSLQRSNSLPSSKTIIGARAQRARELFRPVQTSTTTIYPERAEASSVAYRPPLEATPATTAQQSWPVTSQAYSARSNLQSSSNNYRSLAYQNYNGGNGASVYYPEQTSVQPVTSQAPSQGIPGAASQVAPQNRFSIPSFKELTSFEG